MKTYFEHYRGPLMVPWPRHPPHFLELGFLPVPSQTAHSLLGVFLLFVTLVQET